MVRIRPALAALLALGPFLASPPATEAGGRATSGGARKILPRVACSVVAFPDRGAPVSAGQTVRIPGQSAKVWMKVRLENQGLTPQTVGLQLIFWDGARQAINQTISNVRVTPDQPFESGVWAADLDASTHRVRAVGVILGLKDNAASNDCVTAFTVEVGATSIVQDKAKIAPAMAAPNLTCQVRVVQGAPGTGAPGTGFAPGATVSSSDGRFWVQVELENHGLVKPDQVPVSIVVDEGATRRLERRETVAMSRVSATQNYAFAIPPGSHPLQVQSGMTLPNNQGQNSCAFLFTAVVAGAATAPGPTPPPVGSVFRDRVYKELALSGCLTCHNPNGSAVTKNNRPFLAFGFDANTPKPPDVLCLQVRGGLSPNVEQHGGGFPLSQNYMDAVSAWRDTPPPPAYKCP